MVGNGLELSDLRDVWVARMIISGTLVSTFDVYKNLCLWCRFLHKGYNNGTTMVRHLNRIQVVFSFWNLTVDFIGVHCKRPSAEIYYRHYIDFIVSIVMEEEISAPLCIPVLDTADSDKYLFPPWTIFKNHLSNTPLARIFFCKIQFPWHDRGQKGKEEWRR